VANTPFNVNERVKLLSARQGDLIVPPTEMKSFGSDVCVLLPQLSGTVFPLTSMTVAFFEWLEIMGVSLCLLVGGAADAILL